MSAPLGNQFWKARSSHGRNPKFASSDVLWEACLEYFQWVEDNPLHTVELVKYQGKAEQVKVPKMRAMTIGGLCIFLDIDRVTWKSQADRDNDFLVVVTRVEEIIYDQKFSGAAADLLNANIIARDLGLVDKSANEHIGRGGGPIETVDLSKLTPEQLEAYGQLALAYEGQSTDGAAEPAQDE